jgi:hypothetical protein
MNKSAGVLLCCLLCPSIFSPARAEEPGLEPAKFRIGLGTSLGSEMFATGDLDWMLLPVSFSNFYIPMTISDMITIEPEFGYFRYGSSDSDSESSDDLIRFGMGLFYTPVFGRTALHFGIRIGIISYSSEYSEEGFSDERSKTDFFIGPAVGAEYFFSDQFSLGAEVQLNYIDIGNWEGDEFSNGSDNYFFSNRTHVFIRFYFGTVREADRVDESGPPEMTEPPKKAPPPVAEESPAEIRQVQPPAGEPEKARVKEEEPPPEEKPAAQAPAEVPPCPEGAEPAGSAPPGGFEHYCAKRDERGNPVRHGWFKSWYENSQVASEGDYREGLKQGRWNYYYENGQKRLEAGYQDDKKQGTWVFWGRNGEKQKEERYQDDRNIE